MPSSFISELRDLANGFCRLDFAADPPPEQFTERAAPLEADGVEFTREDLNFSADFLTTIRFRWQTPVKLRLSDLQQALSECHVTRLGTAEQASYNFAIEHEPLPGFVQFTADPADWQGRLGVRSIELHRVAPEPYAVEQGRAIRLVVFADFAASENLSPDPLAIGIGEGVDVNEALARLAPAVYFHVVNHIDPAEKTLHFPFSPGTLTDFEIDRLVHSVPQLSALVGLRQSLVASESGRTSPGEITDVLENGLLPVPLQNRVRTLLAERSRDGGQLVAEIDRMLSNQCEAILSHPTFQSVQSAWLGLQYLAEQIDFSTGSQIDVFSSTRDELVSTLRRGVVEPEIHHREGLPPALVVVDGTTFRRDDAPLVREVAALSAAGEIPLVFGGCIDGEPSPHAGNRQEDLLRFVAGVETRIRLREKLSSRPPRRFEYLPGGLAPETAVWGSGAWAFAAAAAQSIGRRDVAATVTALPAPSGRPLKSADVCLGEPDDSPLPCWRVEFDEAVQKLQIRPPSVSAATEFRTQLVLGPVLQTMYRLRHPHAHRTDRSVVLQLIEEALQARLPGSDIQVVLDGPPGRTRLITTLTPPFPIAGEDRPHTIEIPWRPSY